MSGGATVRTIRALVLLTGSAIRRLLRDPLVLRSVVWPGLVTSGTLIGTLCVVVAARPGRDIAVTADTPVELVATLQERGFRVAEVPDPGAQVLAGRWSMGTDGRDLWVFGSPPSALAVEGILRRRANASWEPVPLGPPAPSAERDAAADLVCRILGLLFVLYGLVFGLGGVARDRDDGTLEAELCLPVPRWTGGAARWIGSTVVLATFYGLSIAAFGTLQPLGAPVEVFLNGVAASATAVAIGLVVVGTAGLRQGFSGPFALGMTLATGMATVGSGLDVDWLPIASLFGDGDGVAALAVSGAIGVASAWLYGRRVGGA